MNTAELRDIINDFCPETMAEPWDKSGFQIFFDRDVEKILITLEVGDKVVSEAVNKGFDFILTHHPLIFDPITTIRQNDGLYKNVHQLYENGISVYSCHTNFDILEGGLNDFFGERLGLRHVRRMSERDPYCRKGELPQGLTPEELTDYVADRLHLDKSSIKLVKGNDSRKEDKKLETLGWCTGAGGDFIENAAYSDIDCFITGDVKYHEGRRAEELSLHVMDIGHFGSEKIFPENMADFLRPKLPDNIEIANFEGLKDPFIYLHTFTYSNF